MISRRTLLHSTLAASAAVALAPARAADLPLLSRPIPRTGEYLPAIGLGTSASVTRAADNGEEGKLQAVLEALHKGGGRIVDTAPAYGASEEVLGKIAQKTGLDKTLFWATKLNVAGAGAAGNNRAEEKAARAQLDASLRYFGKRPIDLVQVHNMRDPATQLPILRAYQQEKRIRYIGITNTTAAQHPALEQLMRKEPLDFIGIDYALDNRLVEQRILPLAADKGIAVLVYAPFGRTRLWETVRGRPLPSWAAEFDAHSWAQFFLKFVLANPTVTAATPATASAKHMADNLQGARGRLPDATLRQRMIAYIANL